MSQSEESPAGAAVGRREFLMLVGAAGLAGALPGAVNALAQAGAPTRGAAPADSTARPDSAAAAAPAGPSADALALAGVLRRRFPDRLSEEQWASVTRDLDRRLGAGRQLRAVRLANAAEPDTTFRA